MPIRVGVAESRVGKLPDTTTISLATQVSLAALADAGIELADVDGVVTTQPLVGGGARQAATIAEYLGISAQAKHLDGPQLGGASLLTGFLRAYRLVESGALRAVIVVAADRPRTGQARSDSVAAIAAMRHPAWEQPFGMSNVSAYALLADHYLGRHGLDRDALAPLAVAMRRHATTHDGAVYRDPITAEDVIASRMIASPLRLLECSPINDGAAAVVIHSLGGRPERPAFRLLGGAEGHEYDNVSYAGRLERTGAAISGARAFDEAGIRPSDVDVALIYDSYTITLALELEQLGFCEPGTAGRLAAEGGLGVDGRIPTNTHGGLLSHSHCGGAAGSHHLVEAIRQLQGTAQNQVAGAEVALLHAEGGIVSCNCTVLLATR